MILKDLKFRGLLVSATLLGATAGMAQMQEYPYSTFKGFQEVNFATSDAKTNGTTGFSLGQFTLHNNAYFSDHVSGFTELTWSAKNDGTGAAQKQIFSPAVERLVVRYDYSDAFKVSAGKYHTATSFWNGYYHHGRWLQTTIDRPKMLGFTGGFIPIHFTGLMFEGVLPLDGWNFNYNLGYGNGRSGSGSTAGEAGDNNNKPAYSATFFIQPDFLGGVRIGGSYYMDHRNDGTNDLEEAVTSAHVVYQFEQPEFIAEFASIDHKYETETYTSTASYVQVGWRFDFMNGAFKPYYRYENQDVDWGKDKNNKKGIFKGQEDNTWQTIGLRWDFTDYACLKFEQQSEDNTDVVTRKIQLASTF